MWPPGASAGSKTAKPRAVLNTRFVRYIFRLAAGAIGEAQRRGGESLTSMTESALSTNLSVFLPSNEMVGQRPDLSVPVVSVASQELFKQCGNRGARRRGVAGCFSGEQSIPAFEGTG